MTPCPTLVGRDESDLFEVSGRFLSSQHSTVEEVMSDHQDIYLALQTRVEVSNITLHWPVHYILTVGRGSNVHVG